MTGRRLYVKDALALAASLAVVLFVVFAPFLVGGRTLMMAARDVASAYPTGALPERRPDGSDGILATVQKTLDYSSGWLNEPALALEHRLVFEQHVLPMWDPYDGFGMPFAAAMQPQPFAPLTFAASAVPDPLVYDWYLVLRLFLAGLGAALYARSFVGFAPSLAGGLATAFTGYYLIYYDMPHLSVEIFFPWALLAVELVVRRPAAHRIALLAAVAALTVVGGMPESTALIWTVAAAYAAFRLIWNRRAGGLVPRAIALVAGAVLGIGMSAIVLLPFAEYVGVSYNVHEPRNIGGAFVGVQADPCFPRCLPQLIAPLAFGPPWNDLRAAFNGANGAQGGVALVAVWLGLVAVLAALRALASRSARDVHGIVLFLAATVLLIEAKRFGALPLVGELPVFRLIVWYKYGEAIVGPACAILAAFGLSETVRAIARDTSTALADLAAVALLVAAAAIGMHAVPPSRPHAAFLYGSLGLAGIALVLAFTARGLAGRGRLSARAAAGAIVAVLALECAGSYAVPMFYVVTRPVPASANPFRPPPYLGSFAAELNANGGRVFGTGHALNPDWAGAYGVASPTAINALYPAPFLPFVWAFVHNSQIDFDGALGPDLGTPLGRRFLRLAAIRYIVAPRGTPLPSEHPLLTAIWHANQTKAPATAFNVRADTIGVRGESALFEHPPRDDVTYETTVPGARAAFDTELGIVPGAYLEHECAAPVRFRLSAERGGRTIAQAERVLDPKRRPDDRRWIPVRLDLRRYAGERVTLRFATLPAATELCNAWAEWGDPRWSAPSAPLGALPPPDGRFRVVHDGDAIVMRFADPLPRAAVYRDVHRAARDDEALRQITAPAFDEARTVVVEASATLPSFARCAGRDEVRGDWSRADRVGLDVTLACPGLLVVRDTWFPGWEARVDGTPVPIARADTLFRAVAVPGGRHRVELVYASRAVRAGLVISLASLAAWLALAVAGFTAAGRSLPRRS